MSVSYAVDFASLLLLGPDETMVVAATSAYSQCTFRIQERNPIHRTLFSMACLVLTVQAAGRVYEVLGGAPGVFAWNHIAQPLVGAATTYFVVNTLSVASAIALSTRQSMLKVWNENFLWSAPSYFVGALVAAVSAWMVMACRALARRAACRAALPDLPHLQGLPRTNRRRAAARERDGGSAPRDDRSAGARDRRQGPDAAVAYPPRPALRHRRGARARHVARTRSRASRPPRCCTTSASWPCPSTSSPSLAR